AIEINPGFVQAYEMLLKLQPDNSDIWAKFGNSLVTLKREAEAITAYQRAIEINPGFVQAYEMLLKLQPDNSDIWAKFGNSLVTLKREAEAITAYQRAIEINPGFVQAYEMLLKLQPDNWDILFRLSNVHAKQNTWKKAIEIYEKLISIKPNLAETHYELAKAIARSRKINHSINSSDTDITIKPDLVKELRHLAEQMSKDSESKQLIEYDKRLIETYPYSSEFFWEMGRLLLMESKREKAMLNFYKSNQIKFYQMLAKGELGAIFVCSLPKSATIYISDGLLKGLNLPGLSLNRNIGGINDYYLNLSYPEKFYNSINRSVTSGVWVDHTNPSEWNVFAISLTLDRLVVNVRDPRQTILSWIAHMNKARTEGNQIELFRNFKYPEGYYLMTLNEKIDWEINSGFLPYAIKWIQGWLDAEKNPLFHPKILFTKFDDLATNPQVFWESILDFYEIEKSRFTFPEPPKFKEGTHYRKGSINEWREVFTPEQADQASSMIPKEFIEKFGWSER
ncbi:tetratricopeptide repeat protein, partial [Microcoleus sp.]|uniref:tetratricopeptide repeat protein n=4 Tax=Microcoleus sp. TaxID=44472 RepID=UPI003526259F